VAALKLLLARVGGSLEPTELDSFEQKSSVVEVEHLYGCFSPHGPSSLSYESATPEHEGIDMVATQALDLEKCANVDTIVSLLPESDRQLVAQSGPLTHVPECFSPVAPADFEGEDIGEFLAPVLQITPELQELCGDSSVVFPSVLCSFGTLEVSTTPSLPHSKPCQSLVSLDRGAVLDPSSEALFAKELCGLLASLEAASSGYGKEIACVLAGKASEDMIKRVKKSLRKVSIRRIRMKRAVTREVSEAG
jgi:hypothetical protein